MQSPGSDCALVWSWADWKRMRDAINAEYGFKDIEQIAVVGEGFAAAYDLVDGDNFGGATVYVVRPAGKSLFDERARAECARRDELGPAGAGERVSPECTLPLGRTGLSAIHADDGERHGNVVPEHVPPGKPARPDVGDPVQRPLHEAIARQFQHSRERMFPVDVRSPLVQWRAWLDESGAENVSGDTGL